MVQVWFSWWMEVTWARFLELDLSSVVRGRRARGRRARVHGRQARVHLPEHLQRSDCVVAMVTVIVGSKDMAPHQYWMGPPWYLGGMEGLPYHRHARKV